MTESKTEAKTLEPRWRWIENVLRRRRWMLFLYAAMTASALPGLWLIETDNSPRAFFADDHQALDQYRRFEGFFGRDQAVRAVLTGPRLWTREGLEWMATLEEEAASWSGVVGAISLYSHYRWLPAEWPPDPQSLRAKALADPLDRNAGWISPDGRQVTALLALHRLSPSRQTRLLEKLEAFLEGAPEGIEARPAGLPVVQRAIDDEVHRFTRRFFPLLVLAAALLLSAAFRHWLDVVRPLVLVAVCQTAVFGAMGYASVRLNMILVLLAPLLFVISMATAVHVLARFRKLRRCGLDAREATLAVYREKTWPVLWTGATTAAAFASLAVADIPPVRSLGIWAGLGIAFMTFACFTLYPALLAIPTRAAPEPARFSFEAWARRQGKAGAQRAVASRRLAAGVFAGLAALSLLGLVWLQTDSNALHYLSSSHPVRVRLEQLEEAGLGIVAAELTLVGRDSGPDFESPQSLLALAALAQQIRLEPLALGVVGPGDVVDAAVRSLNAAAEDPLEARRKAVLELRGTPLTRPMLGALLTRGGQAARVTLLVKMKGFGELEPLFERAAAAARQAFPQAEVFVTGQYPLVLAAQKSLLRTMLLSSALTLAAVVLAFVLLTRNLRLALAALPPNLWAVALAVGGLGWAGLPLDSTTIMIAAVVLGLAVDDTLHALAAFRTLAVKSQAPQAAVLALEQTAPGHILTTAILAAGFGICAFSSFVPVSSFGLIAALALAGALAGDLWLVPALLSQVPAKVATGRS